MAVGRSSAEDNFNKEMTDRSQNFRLLEIAKRETADDPSKRGNEQSRAYPEHRR